ncbi:MAG: RNA polymerase sigma factor [Longimicrobiales bacterium]
MTGKTDAELIESIRLDGSERAFRELYGRHTPRLYQLVLRILAGGAADAEDVVQETWVRATTSLARFRGDSSFGTWLTGIGLNRARDFLRHRSRRPAGFEVDDGDAWLERVSARVDDTGERVDLERAISILPDGYRVVFVLYEIEGFNHGEIARRLGISEGTSKSQLHHARRALRVLLEPSSMRTALEANHG